MPLQEPTAVLLIVEDDPALNRGLCQALRSARSHPIGCHSLGEARQQLACTPASLVLLDIRLPDGSGLDYLQELKADDPRRPVILLTANDTDMDVVEGFGAGADDYITKPFSLAVLRARVEAQLRHRAMMEPERRFQRGPYLFDFEAMQFQVGGRAVELSRTEQRLLALLVAQPGHTLSRRHLIDRLWPESPTSINENALSVTVKRLRDKLGEGQPVETVYGIGYRWRDL